MTTPSPNSGPSPGPGPEKLVALFQRKWAPGLLAELARTGGTRVVVLRNRLGASPQAVASALEQLVAMGLVAPNPGYGHPLRPEYVLTPEGQAAAEACARIAQASERLGFPGLMGYRWPMPVLWTLGEGGLRFREIARRASPITDRALSQSLTLLTDARLVRAELLDVRPPAPIYGATGAARTLVRALGELAA